MTGPATGRPYAAAEAELRARGLLPEAYRALYVAGSVVRGWGNATSDLDIYLVTDEPWAEAGQEIAPVALTPGTVAVNVTYVDGQRWDVEYWLDAQVDQMLAKVSAAEFEAHGGERNQLTRRELDFLERLGHAVPAGGADWLATRREQLRASAFRQIVVSDFLHYCDVYAEDALGQLAAGDLDSSVLSARMAFGCAVDGMLAGLGEFNQSPKWRARRFRAAAPDMPFDEYWAIETMRDFDPAAPGRWVEHVIATCRRIALEVVV